MVIAAACCATVTACDNEEGSAEIDSDSLVRELNAEHREERRLRRLERGIDELKRSNRRAASPPRTPDQPDESSASRDLASTVRGLGGEVGVVAGPPGGDHTESAGGLLTGSAWSTIKVPIALTLLRDVGGPTALSGVQRGQVERALTLSDNNAAAELFGELGRRYGGANGAAGAVTEVLRAGGDTSTIVSTQGRDGFSTYGQTEWSLAAQQRFMVGLAAGCIADRASTEYVLDLMGRVTSDTWGLGSLGHSAQWKGGWGPGTDGRYLVRQMGVIDYNGRQLIVGIAARSNDGQFASSQAIATQLAQRLTKQAADLSGPPVSC
jgi:hypothetical protein